MSVPQFSLFQVRKYFHDLHPLRQKDKVCPPPEGEKILAWLAAPDSPEIDIIPNTGHAIMVEANEIVCDIIDEFLTKLEPHFSHTWQSSNSSDEKWSLKNEKKVPSLGIQLNI